MLAISATGLRTPMKTSLARGSRSTTRPMARIAVNGSSQFQSPPFQRMRTDHRRRYQRGLTWSRADPQLVGTRDSPNGTTSMSAANRDLLEPGRGQAVPRPPARQARSRVDAFRAADEGISEPEQAIENRRHHLCGSVPALLDQPVRAPVSPGSREHRDRRSESGSRRIRSSAYRCGTCCATTTSCAATISEPVCPLSSSLSAPA